MPAYPLALELNDTWHPADRLADAAGMRSWLASVADRLPAGAGRVAPARRGDLVALRDAVGETLRAVVDGRAIPAAAVAELNRAAAGSPAYVQLSPHGAAELRHRAADPADAVLGAIAASAIELVAGPAAADLRTCEAPGCGHVFLKDHPRREWCSPACGNRARQARHYARTRARA